MVIDLMVGLRHAPLFLMLLNSLLKFIHVDILERVLVVLARIGRNLNLVDQLRIDLLADELSVVLSIGVVDAVGLRADEHHGRIYY